MECVCDCVCVTPGCVQRSQRALCVLQTMDRRFLVLVAAAGLLCLSLAPVGGAEDPLGDALQEDLDVEDEIEPGFVDDDDDLEADLQDEAPPAPKTPPTPKVRPGLLPRQPVGVWSHG